MRDKVLRLNELIDADALRDTLTALTRDRGGDGNDSSVRQKVLATLKEASQSGREKAEAMLLEDGSGSACAARLSHLQDEIIRVLPIRPHPNGDEDVIVECPQPGDG